MALKNILGQLEVGELYQDEAVVVKRRTPNNDPRPMFEILEWSVADTREAIPRWRKFHTLDEAVRECERLINIVAVKYQPTTTQPEDIHACPVCAEPLAAVIGSSGSVRAGTYHATATARCECGYHYVAEQQSSRSELVANEFSRGYSGGGVHISAWSARESATTK